MEPVPPSSTPIGNFVGEKVLYFYSKDQHYYGAKVVKQKGERVRLHYIGWSAKNDFWTSCFSDCIAIYDESKDQTIVQEKLSRTEKEMLNSHLRLERTLSDKSIKEEKPDVKKNARARSRASTSRSSTSRSRARSNRLTVSAPIFDMTPKLGTNDYDGSRIGTPPFSFASLQPPKKRRRPEKVPAIAKIERNVALYKDARIHERGESSSISPKTAGTTLNEAQPTSSATQDWPDNDASMSTTEHEDLFSADVDSLFTATVKEEPEDETEESSEIASRTAAGIPERGSQSHLVLSRALLSLLDRFLGPEEPSDTILAQQLKLLFAGVGGLASAKGGSTSTPTPLPYSGTTLPLSDGNSGGATTLPIADDVNNCLQGLLNSSREDILANIRVARNALADCVFNGTEHEDQEMIK